ncbi:hypothetical protein Mmc1_3241 [Magnetococcus marinus MC-1]|uniref:STAS domain-containing protein n=1 Tax=Magnetococcus marinus (strain ATCC BAA-1437 / JCM 17883 / MC-1) TaxID=156889 RepID=A0LCN8_MAGMM|nr:STAS domain-containing protein [Magnetococcus marinus]ABK45731.1 hypothetical protein Mmc1_3241 [Magnetococcus marinus MC-1]
MELIRVLFQYHIYRWMLAMLTPSTIPLPGVTSESHTHPQSAAGKRAELKVIPASHYFRLETLFAFNTMKKRLIHAKTQQFALVIDFNGMEKIDSTGLGMMLQLALEQPLPILLINVNHYIEQLLQMTGMTRFFLMENDRSDIAPPD